MCVLNMHCSEIWYEFQLILLPDECYWCQIENPFQVEAPAEGVPEKESLHSKVCYKANAPPWRLPEENHLVSWGSEWRAEIWTSQLVSELPQKYG